MPVCAYCGEEIAGRYTALVAIEVSNGDGTVSTCVLGEPFCLCARHEQRPKRYCWEGRR